MKRLLLLQSYAVMTVLGILAVATPGHSTEAIKREFKAVYVHEDRTDNVSKSLAAAVKKAGCSVCHTPVKNKKGHYNAYGKQLAKLLKKGDDKDSKKILAALKKVFNMAVDPDVPDITFGQRIHRGKLPAGD
ncbi:MAG: hypothetical protein ACLQLG_12845 [Thermoguttaceae bacterium]